MEEGEALLRKIHMRVMSQSHDWEMKTLTSHSSCHRHEMNLPNSYVRETIYIYIYIDTHHIRTRNIVYIKAT